MPFFQLRIFPSLSRLVQTTEKLEVGVPSSKVHGPGGWRMPQLQIGLPFPSVSTVLPPSLDRWPQILMSSNGSRDGAVKTSSMRPNTSTGANHGLDVTPAGYDLVGTVNSTVSADTEETSKRIKKKVVIAAALSLNVSRQVQPYRCSYRLRHHAIPKEINPHRLRTLSSLAPPDPHHSPTD